MTYAEMARRERAAEYAENKQAAMIQKLLEGQLAPSSVKVYLALQEAKKRTEGKNE